MLEKEKKKVKTKFVVPINGTVGIFKASPIYELNTGLGILWKNEGEERSNIIYLFFADLFQYNRELAGVQTSALIGGAWKTKRAGTFSAAFPLFDNPFNEVDLGLADDVVVRLGVAVHTRNNLAVTTHYYFKDGGGFIPSVTFGFSF